MGENSRTSRRRFLKMSGTLTAGLALPMISHGALAAEKEGKKSEAPEVNPVEDLMREHGVLGRVLLIYEEILKRVGQNREVPAGVARESAEIIHGFIEDYHEKLEEGEIFPRFQGTGKLADLTAVLFAQHQAGRRLTDTILKNSQSADLAVPASPQKYVASMREFIRMYRPHAAWEDTVLFPALHKIVPRREFDEMGGRFEERERQLFGKNGFESIVAAVADLERKLGIFELSKFTPQT